MIRLTLLVLVSAVAAVGAGAEPQQQSGLDELLVRLDETAQLYAERARSFTCEESIRWERKDDSGRQKFGYVVVMDEAGSFDDYRIRLRRRPRSSPPSRVEPEDFGVPAYLRSAYLWVFIFKRERWPLHRYEIVGEERLFDRTAVVLRFEPLPPYRETVNNWFGKAWIDRETAQLLQVEAHRPEDQAELQRIERHRAGEAVSSWVYVVEQITTKFTIEERGMRFPGRVELRQINHDFLRGLNSFTARERTVLEVSQGYSDYRFFETEARPAVEPVDEP